TLSRPWGVTPWAAIWLYESWDAWIGADSHFSPLSHEPDRMVISLSLAILGSLDAGTGGVAPAAYRESFGMS
ncbi:hypothetical protein ACFQ1S_10675, partial [Kibdelosporangium lantanae]